MKHVPWCTRVLVRRLAVMAIVAPLLTGCASLLTTPETAPRTPHR
jgi:hypothetical protein